MSLIKNVFMFYFKSNLLIRILLGLVLGAILGIIFENSTSMVAFFKPFGDLFIRLLKMIVQPVIIFTIIVGTASIAPSKLGKVGIKVLLLYILTSLFAIVIGLLLGNLLNPGAGLELAGLGSAAAKELNAPSLIPTLLAIVPTNPFEAFAKGEVLPTIFFSIFFGIAIAFIRDSSDKRIKDSAETIFRFFEGAAEAIFKVVGWVMQYAPIGVFALIFVVFSAQGAAAFGPLAKVTGTVYLGFIVHLITIYLLLLTMSKLNFFRFMNKIKSPAITAFVTRSSGGTLPISMDVAEHSLGISRGVYGFSLPLGATINMDGTTIYLGVCTMFIASAVGQPLSLEQQIPVILTAVLGSIGTAAVPGAGAIMLLMVLDTVGLKVEAGSAVAAAYAIILGIDALLDMGRTSINVVGDLVVTTITAKSEGEMNMDVWNKS